MSALDRLRVISERVECRRYAPEDVGLSVHAADLLRMRGWVHGAE